MGGLERLKLGSNSPCLYASSHIPHPGRRTVAVSNIRGINGHSDALGPMKEHDKIEKYHFISFANNAYTMCIVKFLKETKIVLDLLLERGEGGLLFEHFGLKTTWTLIGE